MEKRERVQRALAGDTVDRPPISFWWHNFARENSAEELAAATTEQFQRYDWDFIKIQSRATAFAEGWGLRSRISASPHVPPVVTDWPIRDARDLRRVRPLDPEKGALGEQLAALQMIRRSVGQDVPVLATVFSPSMVLPYLFGTPEDRERRFLEGLRHWPTEVHSALAAVRDTLVEYARACLAHGADGIFFAVKAASADQMTRTEYEAFGLPYDRPVLDAAAAGWLNLLHLCGPRLYFDVADDLPSSLLNWALDPSTPSLRAGRDRSRRAVIGGVSPKPHIRQMSPDEVRREVMAALTDTAGVRVMIGPGCSISPDTPEENLRVILPTVETGYARRAAAPEGNARSPSARGLGGRARRS